MNVSAKQFVIFSALVLAAAAAQNFYSEPVNVPLLKPRIHPDKDHRKLLPMEKDSPYEAIGKIFARERGTVTSLGDNVYVTDAHIVEDIQKTKPGEALLGFGCSENKCEKIAHIVEVAFPAKYEVTANRDTAAGKFYEEKKENHGYDIAFVRAIGAGSLESRFRLSADSEMKILNQAGYSYDREGLTGHLPCHIISPSAAQNPDTIISPEAQKYMMRTDCDIVTGDSGSPLFDPNNNIAGVFESTLTDKEGFVTGSLATPITAGLVRLSEDFKKGTLKGETEIAANGIKITKFSYERQPFSWQAEKKISFPVKIK